MSEEKKRIILSIGPYEDAKKAVTTGIWVILFLILAVIAAIAFVIYLIIKGIIWLITGIYENIICPVVIPAIKAIALPVWLPIYLFARLGMYLEDVIGHTPAVPIVIFLFLAYGVTVFGFCYIVNDKIKSIPIRVVIGYLLLGPWCVIPTIVGLFEYKSDGSTECFYWDDEFQDPMFANKVWLFVLEDVRFYLRDKINDLRIRLKKK